MRRKINCIPFLALFMSTVFADVLAQHKSRLIVLTDISSIEAGVREPDDAQSMIRLMLYTNDIDIEGLIASSSMRHGQVVRPELINAIVDAYEKVRPNLLLHDPDYPEAAALREVIKAGQPIADEDVPVFNSIGEGKDTEGSEWIIQRVDHPDERPLWIAIWGGAADLAQALWKVRATRSPEELAKFISKIRVHAIGDQDTTCPWIKAEFPDLFYITRKFGIRGMYRGGDTTLVRSEWVQENIIQNHGALGALYPDYKGGDIWSGKLGRVKGIKEGDTPSFLALLPNGLNVPSEPVWGGWGGIFKQVDTHRYTDAVDPYGAFATDPDERMAGVYRWRPAFQRDFQARLDWGVTSFDQANHPPLASFADDANADVVYLHVVAGEEVSLSAAGSSDPDGDRLSYHWFPYGETDSIDYPAIGIVHNTAQNASFTAPEVQSPQIIHVILSVTDNGSPSLSSYKRIVVTINPKQP